MGKIRTFFALSEVSLHKQADSDQLFLNKERKYLLCIRETSQLNDLANQQKTANLSVNNNSYSYSFKFEY